MSGRSEAPSEQEVQEDLVRLDAYRNQLNAMVQQYQYLSASRSDHLRARETLEGLERSKENVEVLVPLGGDTFVRGAPAHEVRSLSYWPHGQHASSRRRRTWKTRSALSRTGFRP